jgi:peptide/nickel transport system ATP-binding protein
MSIIEIKSLSVDYALGQNGVLHALRNVNLEVNAGESIAIVGESGCGKSTFASSLVKLLALNSKAAGQVLIDGNDVLAMTNRELEAIRGVKAGTIFQDPAASLNPVFSVKEQIEETITAHLKVRDKVELKQRAIKLLEETGIKETQRVYEAYPHQLSGGQQQRVMTAIALSCSPKILIADEPTTALDVTVQAQIIALLKRLKKERNLTLILITHDLHLALDLCARIIVMYAGEVVEDAEIKSETDSKHPYTRALFEIIPDINEDRHEFSVIPGEVPELKTVMNECYFRNRCVKAGKKCSESHPEMENGVRCFYPYTKGRLKA